MRRNDRKVSDSEAFSILEKGQYGILSTVAPDNIPSGVPLNYCVMDNGIYFHCALEGAKVENIKNNPRVSFCVVEKELVVPDQFTSLYECCIVHGLASEVFEEEKTTALKGLICKYSNGYLAEGLAYVEKLKDKTRVFKIAIESISGKANR